MPKVLAALAVLFVVPLAYALSDTEAPMEQVSPTTVFAFLILVVAIIVGFFWWNARRQGKAEDKPNSQP